MTQQLLFFTDGWHAVRGADPSRPQRIRMVPWFTIACPTHPRDYYYSALLCYADKESRALSCVHYCHSRQAGSTS